MFFSSNLPTNIIATAKMAGAQPEHPYHVRSISFPSRSHPLALQFNDELQKMKTWAAEAETTPPPSSSEMVRYGIQGLAKLNTCVENILKMPESQKSIVRSKNETWVTEELEGSVRFLDMCDSTRCSLSLLKEQAQDLQCALRTRKAGDDIFESKAKSYITSFKKSNKEISKHLRELKQMKGRCVLYPEDDASLVIRVVKEVREMTMVVYNSVLSSMVSEKRTQKSTWTLVSKAMGLKNKVVPSNPTLSIPELCKKITNKDAVVVEVQKQLREIEDGVAGFENGLEFLFQGLIRKRIALLNIINL